MINVVDVSHHYGLRPVLRQINLQVNAGEVIALMGPNGMGKSTLMAIMAGILHPLKGHVAIDGKRRRSSEENELAIRQKTVYLPADPWLPNGRTGREWLLAVGRIYKLDDEHLMNHVDRLFALFDLVKQGDSLISTYSTGQKKKIALAGALITEAPVMLLDEPFSGGLDPSGLLALKRVLLHRAKGDDYTIVMAAPVPELVEELADRVAILHEGQLVAYDTIAGLRHQSGIDGPLEAVYEKYVHPETLKNLDRYFKTEAR